MTVDPEVSGGISPYVLGIERELSDHPEIERLTLSRSTVEHLLADLRAAVSTGLDSYGLYHRYFRENDDMRFGLEKLIKRAAWRAQDVAERLCADDLSQMAQEILNGEEPM